MSFSNLGPFEIRYKNTIIDILEIFKVEEEADFEPIQAALKAIAEPNSNIEVADNLKERVSHIREWLNQDDVFLSRYHNVNPHNIRATKLCLLSNIAEMSDYYKSLSPEEKKQYVQSLKEFKARTQQLEQVTSIKTFFSGIFSRLFGR